MPPTRARCLLLLLIPAMAAASALLGCYIPPPAPIQGNMFNAGPGRTFDRKVVTMRQQRWQHIVRQQLDFSCGAAALATLLRYHYEDDVGEREIIEYMLVNGDVARIRREGFSLLDLQNFARSRGYQTQGYRIEADVLERLANPAITLITTRGYSHFVVLRGTRDGYAYLADPAIGLRSVRLDEFESEWAGVVFFVAAQRNDLDPSALANIESRQGPTFLVRPLGELGLRRVVVSSPNEFRF